ncbi:hypothetical protein LTR85_003286 [Meristemomyces frigidus]|nr:hypothetical protein LTR85_003286 [Meristemomyces frigidus]
MESGKNDRVKPKCYFTQATLPGFVDHRQPPTKKKPFSTALSQNFNHTLDVVLPEDAASRFRQVLAGGIGTLQYARVHMKLSEIVEGDFFAQYIKSGNILMLSEGRPGIDHIFSLFDGVLRLEVDKPTFERMGLEGKAMPSEGRKHVKARYAIEFNLRLPSMVRDHKGFERIVWAFKNVLNHSVTWLFCDLQSRTEGPSPLAAFQPLMRSVEPQIEQADRAVVPHFPATIESEDHVDATELLEWLSLVMSLSPRVRSEDAIDKYLSRYSVPELSSSPSDPDITQPVSTIVRFRWHGFIPPTHISTILLAALKASADDWFAMSATSFSGEAYTILKTGDRTLIWEYMN